MAKEKDIFRDTPLRFLGYANELGESFRSVVNVRWVWLSYGIASAYVIADAGSKTLSIRKRTYASEKEKNVRALKEGLDVLTWQSLASVIIPGFTINRICAATKYIFLRTPVKKHAKWITVGVGLSSIPFIIKPIDEFVDYAMDNTFRPWLDIQREHLSTSKNQD